MGVVKEDGGRRGFTITSALRQLRSVERLEV